MIDEAALRRPWQLLAFEAVMIASIAIVLWQAWASFALVQPMLAMYALPEDNAPYYGMIVSLLTPVASAVVLTGVLTWFVSRRGSLIALWLSVIIYAMGVVAALAIAALSAAVDGPALPDWVGLQIVVQCSAYAMLLSPPVRIWFGPKRRA